MQSKLLLALLALGILVMCPQTALGDGIIVDNASAVWDLTLDDATDVDHLIGEPGVFVTKYADTFSYFTLENATAIGRLFGESGVFVTKYADAFVYYSLEDAEEDVQHLVGEPGVFVTKYADTFVYQGLEVPPFTPSFEYFDTGEGTYPSISGTHNGTITPSGNIEVSTLHTYSCPGTGGHTKSIELYENDTLIASGVWQGYQGDWHNITFDVPFTLYAGTTYNYTIETGSYPRIIHASSKAVTGGTITCSEFTDANGVVHYDWIPAIRLWEE
jgi:hypothetical protein